MTDAGNRGLTAGAADGALEGEPIDLREPSGESGIDAIDQRVQILLAEDGSGADSYEAAVEAHQVAKVLANQGRQEEAVALYQRAVAIKQNVLGGSHPDVATTLHNLALLLEAMGRTDEAHSRWAQARAVLEAAAEAEAAP